MCTSHLLTFTSCTNTTPHHIFVYETCIIPTLSRSCTCRTRSKCCQDRNRIMLCPNRPIVQHTLDYNRLVNTATATVDRVSPSMKTPSPTKTKRGWFGMGRGNDNQQCEDGDHGNDRHKPLVEDKSKVSCPVCALPQTRAHPKPTYRQKPLMGHFRGCVKCEDVGRRDEPDTHEVAYDGLMDGVMGVFRGDERAKLSAGDSSLRHRGKDNGIRVYGYAGVDNDDVVVNRSARVKKKVRFEDEIALCGDDDDEWMGYQADIETDDEAGLMNEQGVVKGIWSSCAIA